MNFAAWTVVSSFVLAGWRQFLMVLQYARSIAFQTVVLQGTAVDDVMLWLNDKGRFIRFGDRWMESTEAFIRPMGVVASVVWESPSVVPRIVIVPHGLYRYFGAIGVRARSGADRPSGDSVPHTQSISLTCIRGTCDIVAIVKIAIEYAVSLRSDEDRYQVYRYGGESRPPHLWRGGDAQASPVVVGGKIRSRSYVHWKSSDIGSHRPARPFDSFVLCEQSLAAKQDFDRWLSLRSWYEEKQIPWRRGHLYVGSPGTGKTSLARSLAQSAGIPVYTFDLSSMTNNEFSGRWTDMLDSTPCIALIEDIDAVFHGRDNVSGSMSPLTFDCFINVIGGVNIGSGVFLIITSNHPEKIDAAIAECGTVSRPGRVDRVFSLNRSIAVSESIVRRIAGEHAVSDNVAEMSAAQATEYAVSFAVADMFRQANQTSDQNATNSGH